MANPKNNLPFKTERWTDVKYLGEEPDIKTELTSTQYGNALNWYSYFFGPEAAKQFTLDYVATQPQKYDTGFVTTLKKIKDYKFMSTGWTCRMMIRDLVVPPLARKMTLEKLNALVENYGKVDESKVAGEYEVPEIVVPEEVSTRKKTTFVAAIEDELDNFFADGYKPSTFNTYKFLEKNNATTVAAREVAAYYGPLLTELQGVAKGKTEGYKLTAAQLKNYITFVSGIISDSRRFVDNKLATRKPRKLKIKSTTQIVAKAKIKLEDSEYKIKSLLPEAIVGSGSVWMFNTKTRILTYLVRATDKGLSVKGTTIIGFDEKLSTAKRLRKPQEVLDVVLNGGKVAQRKIMSSLTTTALVANGRLNTDTVILKVNKNEPN